jgi:hypothetical protein
MGNSQFSLIPSTRALECRRLVGHDLPLEKFCGFAGKSRNIGRFSCSFYDVSLPIPTPHEGATTFLSGLDTALTVA